MTEFKRNLKHIKRTQKVQSGVGLLGKEMASRQATNKQQVVLMKSLNSYNFSYFKREENRNDTRDIWLSLFVYAYNTSHESTGYSPFEFVFGRQLRTPVELYLRVPSLLLLRSILRREDFASSSPSNFQH